MNENDFELNSKQVFESIMTQECDAQWIYENSEWKFNNSDFIKNFVDKTLTMSWLLRVRVV